MRAERSAILFLMLSASASAQTATPPAASAAPQVSSSDATVSGNDCLRLYPEADFAAGTEGTTMLSVHLMKDGAVKNPRVVRSSGHEELDQAAIACLTGMRIAPLSHNGAALEVDVDAEMDWRFSDAIRPTIPAPSSLGSSSPCHPPQTGSMKYEGDVLLSFVVAKDGTVKDVAVARSSGHPEFEAASITCVAARRYSLATRDGHPVEYDRQIAIHWSVR